MTEKNREKKERQDGNLICPKCQRDMTPRAGAILFCKERECAFWRIGAPCLYEAKQFSAHTEFGVFRASGTLCGHIDFAGPFAGTYALSPDEAQSLIMMLQQAKADVLNNSDPLGDPRIRDVV